MVKQGRRSKSFSVSRDHIRSRMKNHIFLSIIFVNIICSLYCDEQTIFIRIKQNESWLTLSLIAWFGILFCSLIARIRFSTGIIVSIFLVISNCRFNKILSQISDWSISDASGEIRKSLTRGIKNETIFSFASGPKDEINI